MMAQGLSDSVVESWDRAHGIPVLRVLQGHYYVTQGEEVLSTTLGSCVCACIRDPIAGVAGMNHFMLPEAEGRDEQEARYGNRAMKLLIDHMLQLGANKHNFEIKLFGGGFLAADVGGLDIGQKNIAFIKEYLRQEQLPVTASDLGGHRSRKVLYFSGTGVARVKNL